MVIWHYNLRIVQKPCTKQDWHLSIILALQDGQCENSLDTISINPPPPGWRMPLPPSQKQLSGGRAAALCQGLTPGMAERFGFLSWKLISYKDQPGCKRDATWKLSPLFFFKSSSSQGCFSASLFSGISGFSTFRNWWHFRSSRKGVTGHPAKNLLSLAFLLWRNTALSAGPRWGGVHIY